MIEYLNFYHCLYFVFALGLLAGLYFLLRNKSKTTSDIVLFCILLSSFILHFLKLTADYYQDRMPWAMTTITPENLCAVSTLVFPWFYVSKKAILRDYMFYMGVVSGLGATLYPIDAVGLNVFEFETVRFFYCHILIWVIPLLMVLLRLHTPCYKRILKVPFLAYLIMCVILVNEVILTGAGYLRPEYLYSNEIRNASFIFGPQPKVGILGKLFTALTPEVFLTIPVGENAGSVYYWPIIWLMIPSYIYFCLFSLLMVLPFEYKNIWRDIVAVKEKIKSALSITSR